MLRSKKKTWVYVSFLTVESFKSPPRRLQMPWSGRDPFNDEWWATSIYRGGSGFMPIGATLRPQTHQEDAEPEIKSNKALDAAMAACGSPDSSKRTILFKLNQN